MVSEDTTIVKLNQYQKSDKAPFIIHADLECIIEKVNVKVILKTHLHLKLSEHIPSGFSMPTISSYRIIEDKHDMHRGKDFRKKFCKFLSGHTMKIIIFKKKLLRKEQQESYENSKNMLYL